MEDEEYEFEDTMMSEPEEEEFYSTSDKILKLTDRLAEDIVLDNIENQLSTEMDTINQHINYVELFKEKYSSIDPADDCYDEAYMKESLVHVADVISQGIKKRYGVEVNDDLDFDSPATYLKDMSVLYEFLFIRHYDNLADYFSAKLKEDREKFLEVYRNIMENDETHSKDLFVIQSKKKFKNEDDVIIMHFINEIISDIRSQTTSAYTLFNYLCKLDFYEEVNHDMSELLFNYGNKLVIEDDSDAADLYFKPLDNPASYSEIRNTILMDYIEECEINV